MTLTPAPVAASTSSGAALPLVALPQRELLTVNEKNVSMVRNAVGQGVHVLPLRLEQPDRRARLEVAHYHTGAAEVFHPRRSLELPQVPHSAADRCRWSRCDGGIA